MEEAISDVRIRPPGIGRSIWAVLAGFLIIVILSIGTDIVLHATGVFPQGRMADSLFAFATSYRFLYAILGSYIAARMAPRRPMTHALILGVIGVILAAIGAFATAGAGPELGPRWYPLSLVAISLPAGWLGGLMASATQGY